MEWNGIFQLDGTFKDHLAELPDHFGANKKLKHIAECIIQMPLEH